MAKYADYATEPQTLEGEIDEAAAATAAREPEQIPEQFKGKTAVEIAASYTELQRMNSQQANELGELRRTTSTLTDKLLNSSPPTPAPIEEPVTVDDLYADPEAVLNRKVDERVSGKLERLEQAIVSMQHNHAATELERKFPNYQDRGKSPEMQAWLQESGYRQRLAQAADRGDLQAAEDLFSMYDDLQGGSDDNPDPLQRQQQLDAAALESGTSDIHSPVAKFSRSKVILAKQRAKMGDQEAEQYLKENADEIFRAYEEGRLVN